MTKPKTPPKKRPARRPKGNGAPLQLTERQQIKARLRSGPHIHLPVALVQAMVNLLQRMPAENSGIVIDVLDEYSLAPHVPPGLADIVGPNPGDD